MNKKCNYLYAVVFLILSLNVFAQEKINTDELKKTHSGAMAAILNREQTIRLNLSGDKLIIKTDYFQQNVILGNKFAGFNERHVSYSPGFYEIEKLEASTYVPQEKGYKKIKVKNFIDEGSTGSGNIFYDGTRYKKFFYSGVAEDAITEIKYTYNVLEPSHIGPFYFLMGTPVVKEKYTVIVGSGIDIGYVFFGDSSFVTHSVITNAKQTIHTWEAKNVKADKDYDDAVNPRYYEPHVYVYIKNYKKGKETISLFGSPLLLYRYGYNHINKLNKDKPTEQLQLLIDSINKTTTSTEEKIRSTFYWVQDHIKYIAIEDGMGGQVPREANDVFTKRFGDCKDLASLISYMLNNMNIDAYLTWIGSRDIPYTYKALPLPYATNHMIAAVNQNNQWVFLDATSQYTPYKAPSCFTQQKQAMIAISPDSFVIAEVPLMEPKFNYSFEKSTLTIENDKLKGEAMLMLTGYNKSYNISSIVYRGTHKKEEYIKNLLSLGNNKCEVTGFTHNNMYNKDSDMVFSFTYTLPDYIKIIDKDIYINMHLRKTYSDYKIDTSEGRIAAREFEYAYEDRQEYELEIPKNYQLKKMPENKSYTGKHFQYAFTYEVKNNKIIFRKQSLYNKLTVEPNEFDEWNKQMTELLRIYKDMVILTKTN